MKMTWLITLVFCICSARAQSLKPFRLVGTAQGTSYHITYYAPDSVVRKHEADSILTSIDHSLSLYKPESMINRFNRSKTGISVDKHFLNVYEAARKTYFETDGFFDMTVYPLTEAWGFGPVRQADLPDSATIRSLLPCVGTPLLKRRKNKLIKKRTCVRLDFNGIAQGYSVDVLAGFAEQKGLSVYIIELGGEIRVKGEKPGGQPMSVGIEAPGDDPFSDSLQKIVYIREGAITTSGNYRRYIESGGKKYGHVLDPRTGFPTDNEIISVTVYAPDAMTADAYDNALMSMGLVRAKSFVADHPELAAYFIYRKPDGSIAEEYSERFKPLLIRP